MRIEEVVQSSDRPAITIGRLWSTLRWENLPAYIKDERHSAASLSFSKPNKYNLQLNQKYEMYLILKYHN